MYLIAWLLIKRNLNMGLLQLSQKILISEVVKEIVVPGRLVNIVVKG